MRKENYRQWSRSASMAIRDRRVTHAQYRTLSALGIYADKAGTCFPSMETLEQDLGKDRQQISADLRALEEYGYVKIMRRYNTSNYYQLFMIDDADNADAAYYQGKRKRRDNGNLKRHVLENQTYHVLENQTSDVLQPKTLTSHEQPTEQPNMASSEKKPLDTGESNSKSGMEEQKGLPSAVENILIAEHGREKALSLLRKYSPKYTLADAPPPPSDNLHDERWLKKEMT